MSLLDAFRERRPFPGQDPWVVSHDGSFLLVQSAGGNRRIVVKRFDDPNHMERNVETLIWAPGPPGPPLRHVWAPELHLVDGRWYVYFSASDGPRENHRSYALVADEPLGPYTLLGPVSDPNHDFWSIDLTVFEHEGRLYAAWSGWDGPHDGFPQNLYVAPMSDPWTICGERVCVSRPELEWELSVAPVNEGPEVVRHPETGRLFMLYSADASWTHSYKMGLLEWTGGDILDPTSWHKLPGPLITGGGHGCVVETSEGSRLVYHRKLTSHPGWADREIRWAPVTWDTGYPVAHIGDSAGNPKPTVGTGKGPSLGRQGPANGID